MLSDRIRKPDRIFHSPIRIPIPKPLTIKWPEQPAFCCNFMLGLELYPARNDYGDISCLILRMHYFISPRSLEDLCK